jgi:oligosaccharide repeat unit polymerase
MLTIYIAILCLIIFAHQIYAYFRFRGFRFFNDYAIIDIVLLLFYVYFPIVNEDFSERVDLTFYILIYIGVFSLYAGLHFAALPMGARRVRDWMMAGRVSMGWTSLAFCIFVLTTVWGIIAKYQIGSLGELREYFLVGISQEELRGGILEGDWISRVASSFAMPVLVFFNVLIRKKRLVLFTLTVLLTVCIHLIAIGSRYFIAVLIVLPLVYVYEVVKWLRIIMVPMIVAVILLSFTILDIVRQREMMASVGISTGTIIERSSRDLNPVMHSLNLYEAIESGRIKYDYGYQYLLKILTPIPREMWAEKPLTSFQPRYTEKVYGEVIGTGVPVNTFTILGEGFAILGVFGVALHFFLFGYIYRFLRYLFDIGRDMKLVYLYLCLLIPTYVRGALTDFITGVILLQVCPLVIFLGLCRKRSTFGRCRESTNEAVHDFLR